MELMQDPIFTKTSDIILDQRDHALICTMIMEQGIVYQKYRPVFARIATEIVEITTTTSSGTETTNVAMPGDYIVMNQTDAQEQYIVKAQKFDERYVERQAVDDVWMEYSPVGKIFALELTDQILYENGWPATFNIIAAWGEKMICQRDDYLACPLDGSEFYRIDKKEFYETYKIVEK